MSKWNAPFDVGYESVATPSLRHDEATDALDRIEMTNGELIFLARHCLLNALQDSPVWARHGIIDAFAKACHEVEDL